MKKPLISIVVPIYNVEKYLERCIMSLVNQTYKNLEIILIDDGATDSSGKICDSYAKKDSRIKVIHKENGGLSDARNVGIDNSTGKYITFVDSDDTISGDYIETLYKIMYENNCDIAICAYRKVLVGKITNMDKKEKIIISIMNSEECLKKMLISKEFDISACTKLYKRKVIKNIYFPVGKLCEDNGTTYKFIMKANKICFIHKKMYNYYMNTNSIMNSKFNWKKYDLVELTDKMCDDIEKKYPQISDVLIRRKVYSRLSFLRQALLDDDIDLNDLRIIESKRYVLNHKTDVFINKYFLFRDKIAIVCLMFGNKFYRLSWKLYSKIR